MSTEHLSALDATFLELEQADRGAHMHIGAVLVFEPPTGGQVPALHDVETRLAERLDALPRYRERLSRPAVGGMRFPAWEPDPDFRLSSHLRRAALPAPGGAAELLQWAGDFYSHRLDRSRPLWELVLLEGLDGGRWALCTKTHHCLADGVGSIDAGTILLDGAEGMASAWRPPHRDGGSPVGAPVRALRAGVELLSHPTRTLERSAALVELVVRDEVIPAPQTSLNAPLGEHRRLATVGVSLDDLRTVKQALGGTVNDVVLAAVTAGLRDLLLARGEQPPAGLRAMVPVNVRAAADRLRLGNRISSLFVRLPVDIEDPLERYHEVRHEASSLKGSGQAVGSSTLLDLAEHAPPVLHSLIARSLFATRLFNVTVTNVPGPQVPMHAFGSRLRDAIPIVPLAADHSVGVAVLSADGRVVFCLNCDRDAVPDAHVAATGIRTALDELHALAAAVAAAPPA
jgi:diacylglycerol O-acyltransferase / wax synthase